MIQKENNENNEHCILLENKENCYAIIKFK